MTSGLATPVNPLRTHYVSVRNQRLRVTLAGEGHDGVPLVLVNGLGATADLYDTLRQHLVETPTIAFDAPGVNRSPAPLMPVRMSWYADIVAGMAKELGYEHIDVLGVSWGGALVQELAWRHPRLVRRVVLVATTPGLLGVPGRPAALALLMTPARYYSPTYLQRIAPTLYGGDILDHPDLLADHAHQRSHHRPSLVGYAYQLAAIMGFSSTWYLRRLRQPVLVLAGDDDPIIPVTNGHLLAGLIPDGRLHVVEGGGHLFLFTRAKEMAGLVEEFLTEEG